MMGELDNHQTCCERRQQHARALPARSPRDSAKKALALLPSTSSSALVVVVVV